MDGGSSSSACVLTPTTTIQPVAPVEKPLLRDSLLVLYKVFLSSGIIQIERIDYTVVSNTRNARRNYELSIVNKFTGRNRSFSGGLYWFDTYGSFDIMKVEQDRHYSCALKELYRAVSGDSAAVRINMFFAEDIELLKGLPKLYKNPGAAIVSGPVKW